MYSALSSIALAFIAVALLAVMVDHLTRVLQAILPFPSKFETPLIYIFLVTVASMICWQGRFDLFTLLGFTWSSYPELGWVLTGCIIAGGSSLLGKQFHMVGLIPSIISGIQGMFGYGGNVINADPAETKTDIPPEELNQSD
jgi:hypothetical protein